MLLVELERVVARQKSLRASCSLIFFDVLVQPARRGKEISGLDTIGSPAQLSADFRVWSKSEREKDT